SVSESAAGAYRIGKLEMLALYTRRDGHEVDAKDSNIVNPADYGSDNALAKLVYHWDGENTTRLAGEFFDRQTDTNLGSARRSFSIGPTTTFVNNVAVSDNLERFRVSLDHSYRAAATLVSNAEPKDAKSTGAVVPAINEDNW